MTNPALVESTSLIEQLGVGLPLLVWTATLFAVGAMSYALRREKRIAVHIAGVGVAAIALAANLADYLVAISRAPDFDLEANPLWRVTVDSLGLETAKLYGLSGKILVSILAGQMFAFYLTNLPRLYPRRAETILEFARRLGNRSRTTTERVAALFTMFAFLFAGVQPLSFYVAFVNGIDDPERVAAMPSVFVVAGALLSVVWLAFLILSYRSYRSRPRRRRRFARTTPSVRTSPAFRRDPVVRPATVRRVASR